MDSEFSATKSKSLPGRAKWATLLAFAVPLLLGSLLMSAAEWHPNEGEDLIGTEAPEFQGLQWVNSAPITLHGLRGKAVLLRFWLSGCPRCENSADALNYLYEKYGNQGLIVIGIHHPKSESTQDIKVVHDTANKLGFTFPVAQDLEWKTINSFWLGKVKRTYTSATFLIDKSGHICWLHDGGTLRMSGPDSAPFVSLKEKIASILSSAKH
jgi:peroxiredoxin